MTLLGEGDTENVAIERGQAFWLWRRNQHGRQVLDLLHVPEV